MVVWQASRASAPAPYTAQLHRLRNPADRRRLARALAVGLVLGLAAGLLFGLMFDLGFGLTFGLALGLRAGLAEPVTSDATPTDPRHPVRDDLAVGLTFGLAAGLTFGLTLGPPFGLTFGLAVGLYFVSGAGRRYLAFLCCSRGLLPWRLGAFLHWAYEAGLLRISGMAYQFRHRELQDWLVAHPLP
ncbi:hypothetical protein ACFZDJ_27840 [Streptomyces sp. NPDC007896]|uniref:hypothetical protein n=1 Tax=Streptomyces sp. NPDC007896 TaxID=3364784 RepID=UPI0036EB4504